MSKTLADKKRKLEKLQKEVAAEEQNSESELWALISEAVSKSVGEDRLLDMARAEALQFSLHAIILDTRISGWWNSSLSYGGSNRFAALMFRNQKGVLFRCTGWLVRAATRGVTFAIEREGAPQTSVELSTAIGRSKFCESDDAKKAWPFSKKLFSLVKSGSDAELEQVAAALQETCKTWLKRMKTVLESDNSYVRKARRRNPLCDVGLRAALKLMD